jgi:hypothetical protein
MLVDAEESLQSRVALGSGGEVLEYGALGELGS